MRKAFKRITVKGAAVMLSAALAFGSANLSTAVFSAEAENPAPDIAAEQTEDPVISVTVNGTTTSYTDFDTAWKAAQDANTAEITLLNDIEITTGTGYVVESGDDFTINGGEYTLKTTSNEGYAGWLISVYGGGKLTINSGKFEATASGYWTIETSENASFTINGGEFSSNNVTLMLSDNRQTRIFGGKISGGIRAISMNTGMKLCEILGNYGDDSTDEHYAIKAVDGDYYSGDKLNAMKTPDNETVEVVRCDHGGSAPAHSEKCQYCLYTSDPHIFGADGVCTAAGCSTMAEAAMTISGETKHYPTIEEALQAAYDELADNADPEVVCIPTINFLQDINIDEPLVIDFNSIHRYKQIMLKSDNNSTITSSDRCVIDVQRGTLTLESGNYVSTGTTNDDNKRDNDKGALSVTSNSSYVVIKGGVFEGKEYGLYFDGGTVRLKGGSFTGGTSAICSKLYSLKYMVENSEHDDIYYAFYRDGSVVTELEQDQSITGTVMVKRCTHDVYDIAHDGITHGTCLGCGKILTDEYHVWDANNKCEECGAVAVAEYGGMKFASLENAWKKATDAGEGEIKLLNDVNIKNELYTYQAAITIDGCGHTITADAGRYDYNPFINDCSLTIKNCVIKDCRTNTSGDEYYDILIINIDTLNLINCDIIPNANTRIIVKSYDISKVLIDGGKISAIFKGIELDRNCRIRLTGGCEITGSGDSFNGSDTCGIVLGEKTEAEFDDFKVTNFKTEIETTSKNVNEYLTEDRYFWNADGTVILEGMDVKKYDGDVDVHPCAHENTVTVGAKEATCTEVGYTGDTVCEKCRKTMETGAETEPTGHSGGNATCVKPAVCDKCNTEYGEVDPQNHVNTALTGTVEASCAAVGYTGDTVCGDCGTVITKGTDIEKLQHIYRSKVTTKPTVSNEGVHTYTCENCGDSYTESIPKLNKPTSSPTTGGHIHRPANKPDPSDTPENTGGTSDVPGENTGNTPEPQKPEAVKPCIKGDNGKEGWDVIRAETEITKDGGGITVEMNGTTEVPGDILNSIKDKDITITFDMGDGISWSVNGKDITAAAGSIDFGVKVGSSSIPVDVINNVTGENYSLQLSLSYEGEFGFKAVLSVELGAESAGCYASLYYYNEAIGEPEFISESKIAEDGIAYLEFTHASDYIIVVDEKSMFDEDDTEESPDTSETSETPETSDTETESGTEDTAESEDNAPASSEGNSADSGESSPTSGESSPAEENPKTGEDISYIAIWAAAAGMLAGVMVAFAMTRRKKDRRRN